VGVRRMGSVSRDGPRSASWWLGIQTDDHNARGANKQQAPEPAFQVKKGGSAAWHRASQLFVMAMDKE